MPNMYKNWKGGYNRRKSKLKIWYRQIDTISGTSTKMLKTVPEKAKNQNSYDGRREDCHPNKADDVQYWKKYLYYIYLIEIK